MWLVGVVVRRYIDFLILLIPTPLVEYSSFLQQHPYFLLIFKMFFRSCSHTSYPYTSCIYLFFFAAVSLLFVIFFTFLFLYLFVIKFYV